MPTDEELYLDYLDKLTGAKPEFQLISKEDNSPPVYIATYQNMPKNGVFTSFTLGLSSVDYEHWQYARPELMIRVNSTDISWGLAVGTVANHARGKYGFHLTDTVNFNAKIAHESEMSAFLIYHPLDMNKEITKIKLPGRTITLLQMIPIYDGEMRLIRENGFEWFTKLNPDIYDVQRKDLSIKKSEIQNS